MHEQFLDPIPVSLNGRRSLEASTPTGAEVEAEAEADPDIDNIIVARLRVIFTAVAVPSCRIDHNLRASTN